MILFLIKLFYNNLYIGTKTIKMTLIVECDIVFIFMYFWYSVHNCMLEMFCKYVKVCENFVNHTVVTGKKSYSQTYVKRPYKTRHVFGFFSEVAGYCCMKVVQKAFCATFIQQ